MIATHWMHISTANGTESAEEKNDRKYHHSTLKLTGSYINNGRIYVYTVCWIMHKHMLEKMRMGKKRTPYHTSHIMHCQNGNFYYFVLWIFVYSHSTKFSRFPKCFAFVSRVPFERIANLGGIVLRIWVNFIVNLWFNCWFTVFQSNHFEISSIYAPIESSFNFMRFPPFRIYDFWFQNRKNTQNYVSQIVSQDVNIN